MRPPHMGPYSCKAHQWDHLTWVLILVKPTNETAPLNNLWNVNLDQSLNQAQLWFCIITHSALLIHFSPKKVSLKNKELVMCRNNTVQLCNLVAFVRVQFYIPLPKAHWFGWLADWVSYLCDDATLPLWTLPGVSATSHLQTSSQMCKAACGNLGSFVCWILLGYYSAVGFFFLINFFRVSLYPNTRDCWCTDLAYKIWW